MDKKILQQTISDSMADRANISKRKAEAFVRSFFEITEEALLLDGVVKVKGFGTTKTVTVSDRESVNINTGERFQIEGHDKISFTPDANFRDLVNAPFAHFTTIVIDDEETVTAIDALEMAVPTPEVQQHRAGETDDNASFGSSKTVEKEDGESREDSNSKSVEAPTTDADKVDETESIIADVSANADSDDSVENMSHNATVELTSKEQDMQPIIINNNIPETSRNRWQWAFCVVVTLVLMIVSYFLGYYRVFCPCLTECAHEPSHTEVAETVTVTKPCAKDSILKQVSKEETIKTEIENSRKAELAAAGKYHQMEGGSYLITGILENHTFVVGDNLYKIAKKAYGDKALASYIIFHNNIENPDIVQLGQTIEIPKLTQK